jgi:hypothetical protein
VAVSKFAEAPEFIVTARPVPAIHILQTQEEGVDFQHKPGMTNDNPS